MKKEMSLRMLMKVALSICLIALSPSLYSQLDTGAVHFNCDTQIGTGYDFSNNGLYDSSAVDKYWAVLPLQGSNTLSPKAGNVHPGSWVDENLNAGQWVSAIVDNPGTYIYRLYLCVDTLCPEEQEVPRLFGDIAANNSLLNMSIDGHQIVDFSTYAACSGGTRAGDFLCLKHFDVNVPINLLTSGVHVLEIVTSTISDTTGLEFRAVVIGFTGWILPSSFSGNNVTCTPTGQIRGVVFNDTLNLGVKDNNELLIPNRDIYLYNATDGTLIQSVKTDATGAYNFYGLDRQITYKVSIDGYYYPYGTQTFPNYPSPNFYTVSFTGDTLIQSNKDFGLTRVFDMCSASGKVYKDKNINGTYDSGDTLKIHYKVYLFQKLGNITKLLDSVYTDNNGDYLFNAGFGGCTFYIKIPVYAGTSLLQPFLCYYELCDRCGTQNENLDFGLINHKDTTDISGSVYYNNDSSGVYNSGESFDKDQKVYLYHYDVVNNTVQKVDSVLTDGSGNYKFTGSYTDCFYIVSVTPPQDMILTQPVGGAYLNCSTDDSKNLNFGIFDPKGPHPPPPLPPSCAECVPEFSPLPLHEYLLSAWVKEDFSPNQLPDTYANGSVNIYFELLTPPNTTIGPMIMKPAGPIVDGWQRIEASFIVPVNAHNIQIELSSGNSTNDVYFDDIRIHPFSSNMKSFVYNPDTQKLEAILDENNYSTQYEYDDEGILVRVKKETERGVMTIKETRNNQSKIPSGH